jgi:hypothetical protein
LKQIHEKIFERSRGDIMMEYAGYIGNVEFDNEDNIFYGEALNLRES